LQLQDFLINHNSQSLNGVIKTFTFTHYEHNFIDLKRHIHLFYKGVKRALIYSI